MTGHFQRSKPGTIQSASARFVHDGGKISPGYSPGIMTFTGNMNFTNSILDIEIEDTGTAGKILIR